MALGRPAVATHVGGVSEAVVHEQTGLLVPTDDEPAFASALLRLVADPGFRLGLGENARQRHRARFGISRMVEEYAKAFEAVLGAKGAAPT
jgi:glycosyltransferase involved in cell wall biosynthesis